LGINASRKRFWRVFDDHIGFYSLALYTLSLPRIPARHRHAEQLSVAQLEIGAAEHLACCSCAHECGEAILLCEAGNHFRRAVGTLKKQFEIACFLLTQQSSVS